MCRCDIDVLDPDCTNPEHMTPPVWVRLVCSECGKSSAGTYVVTTLDPEDPNGTQTAVCRECDDRLRQARV